MNQEYDFSAEKNHWLKQERGVSFEEVIAAIESDALLEVINHLNKKRYLNQKMYVVDINGYVHLIPFVKNATGIFLKTIFKSRKMTRQYLQDKLKE